MDNVFGIEEFIKKYFGTAAKFAKLTEVDESTVYRMKKKGVLIVGTKQRFTLYHPKQTFGFELERDKSQLSLPDV